jgi:hypothetical protein
MPEPEVKAGELDKTEKVLDVFLPSGDEAAEVVHPGHASGQSEISRASTSAIGPGLHRFMRPPAYGFAGGGCGFGIRNVHARPYTKVFPTKLE